VNEIFSLNNKMKIKIILTVSFVLATGFVFSGKALADCATGQCRTACLDTEKATGESCSFSAGEYNQEGSCCVVKSGSDLLTGKVCSEDKGMVAGRCYVSGSGGTFSMGCSGIGPSLALGEKGTMGCPSDQICCKTQEYQDATQGKPETSTGGGAGATGGAGGAAGGASGTGSDATGGLVPCKDNCTLCHIVIGFKKIFDWLMGLLFIATMLVITISGVFYMVSTGSKGMMDKAKKALTYALTAFVLGMGCWLVVNIIMLMVGFQNPTGGNWWEFTCDTTQTQGAVVSGGGTAGTGTGGGTAPGDYKPSPCADGAVKNAQALQDKTIYDQGSLRGQQDSNGYWHLDCSAFVNKAWQDAGLQSPGGNTKAMKSSYTITSENRSSAGPGDLLLIPNQHVVMCVDVGCHQVIHSSGTGVNVKVSNGDYYISKGAGVIKAADYGGSSCKTAMLIVLFAKI
jgi:hypothetical protein